MPEIKPVFKCDEEFKAIFKYSRCLITISVGQEVHEGEKFWLFRNSRGLMICDRLAA